MTVITRFHEFGDQDGSGGKADREALLASGGPQAERDVCLASAAVVNEPMTAVVCSIGPNSTPSPESARHCADVEIGAILYTLNISAKVACHGRFLTFRMVEAVVHVS